MRPRWTTWPLHTSLISSDLPWIFKLKETLDISKRVIYLIDARFDDCFKFVDPRVVSSIVYLYSWQNIAKFLPIPHSCLKIYATHFNSLSFELSGYFWTHDHAGFKRFSWKFNKVSRPYLYNFLIRLQCLSHRYSHMSRRALNHEYIFQWKVRNAIILQSIGRIMHGKRTSEE